MTTSVWILTMEVNDYDQYGEYFEEVYFTKPTREQLRERLHLKEDELDAVLAGEYSRLHPTEWNDRWFKLTEYKGADDTTD